MVPIIKITDAAATQIKTILESNSDKKALRITIEGGGCSGFSYKFDLESKQSEDDIVFEKNGAQCISHQLRNRFCRQLIKQIFPNT